MRNRYIKRIMALTMSTMMLLVPITSYAEQNTSMLEQPEGTISLVKTFNTTDESDNGRELFEDIYEKDGISYELSNVSCDTISVQEVEGDTYLYRTEMAGSEEELEEPSETIEYEGISYTLKSKEIKKFENENYTKHVERTVLYKGIEDKDQIPGLAEIVEKDLAGNEVSKYMPLIELTVEKENWDSTFEFPIKITNYDADTFLLNGTEIKKTDALINYEMEFLEYLGLDKDYYRIDSIEWDGEQYTSKGIVYRNAVAKGDKVVKDITALYGGEMVFGKSTQYAYECVYVNHDNPDSTIYTKKATAIYSEIIPETIVESESESEPEPLVPGVPSKNFFQKFADWVVQNPIAALGIGTLLIIGIIIIILFLLSRKKKEEEEAKFEVVDLDEKDSE